MEDFFDIQHGPGRTIRVNGEQYLYFGGTAYLGINTHSAFISKLRDSITQYGSNFGSSRWGNVQPEIYEDAESLLSYYTGFPAAVTCSSGFMAGRLIVSKLSHYKHIIYAPHTHPALWQDEQDNQTGDMEIWQKQLPDKIAAIQSEEVVIMTNTVDAIYGDIYNFEWVNDLPANKTITLVVDDAHGLGILGPNGAGGTSNIPKSSNVNVIMMASLGKALGLPGGIIAGNTSFIEEIKSSPFFGGSSPIPPAYLHAFLQTQDLYTQARNILKENMRCFEEQLGEYINKFQYSSPLPVFYTPENELYDFLQKRKILVPSFSYPSKSNNIVTRIVISAAHQQEDIKILCQHVKEFFDQQSK